MSQKKACLYIAAEKQGTNNYPFEAGSEGEGFKNMLYSFVELKKELHKHLFNIATRDIHPPEDCELVFCFDNPHLLKSEKKPGQIWCLIINDPPMYCPESWNKLWHDPFDFVFTFDETLVDGKKYYYYPFAIDTEYFSIPPIVSEDDFKSRILATFASHAIHKYRDKANPGSTIHTRYETIKWYGKHHPNDFGFYGSTFIPRDYYFAFRGISLVRKILPARIFKRLAALYQADLIKVFKGELKPLEKFDVIRKYRFYYCYENTVGINGYICEKIFDCFYCGVVPVYWGAPNIHELIPYHCFIDGRDYGDQDSLFQYLKNMTYDEFREYLVQAHVFLNSVEMDRFTVRNSIACILKPLITFLDKA